MIDYDPIEGVDYIFDRFAYLGLPIDATKKDIEKAIRDKRAEVHPDRLVNVHADVLKSADRIRTLINQCAEILLNDDLCPLYILRLQEFQNNKPGLVSNNGTPIINLANEKLNLDFLLNEGEVNLEALKTQIQALSGYNPKQLTVIKRMYAASPEDADNRSLLEVALTAKLTYLTILEEAAWARAGIVGYKSSSKTFMVDPEEYIALVEQEIAARHVSIVDHVAARSDAMRIGVAQAPLLLEDMSADKATASSRGLSADIQQTLVEKAQKVYVARAELIREVAKEKKQVLAELVEISVIEDLGITIDATKPYGLHLIQLNEDEPSKAAVITSFQVDSMGTITEFRQGETMGMSVASLKDMGLQGATIVFNQEVGEPTLQIARAARIYTEKYIDAHVNRPADNLDTDKTPEAARPQP